MRTVPPAGATFVQVNSGAIITFSEPMNTSSVSVSFVPAVNGTSVFWGLNGSRISLSRTFAPNTTYSVTVAGRDLAMNGLSGSQTFSFTTGSAPDAVAPMLVSSTPSSGAANVPSTTLVSATFSEPMNRGSFIALSNWGAFDLGAPSWNAASTTVSFPLRAPFDGASTHLVVFNGTDVAGNLLSADGGVPVRFTTAPPVDTLAPTVASVVPATGAVAVPRTSGLSLSFSEPMNTSSVQAAFRLNGAAAAGTFTWNAASTTLSFRPATQLSSGTTTVALVAGATDLVGNPLAAWQSSFTVGSTADTLAPAITSTSPASGSAVSPFVRTSVPGLLSVSLTFSEPMNRVATEAALQVTAPTGPVAGRMSWSANTLIFTPTEAFAHDTSFTISLASAARDASDNHLSTAYSSTFRTFRLGTVEITPILSLAGFFTRGATPAQHQLTTGYPPKVGLDENGLETTGIVTLIMPGLPPNANVLSALFLMKQVGVVRLPFDAGASVVAEFVNGGATLEVGDIDAPAVGGPFTIATTPALETKAVVVTSQLRAALATTPQSNLKLRMRLQPLPTVADTSVTFDCAFRSLAGAPASPSIEVQYEAP